VSGVSSSLTSSRRATSTARSWAARWTGSMTAVMTAGDAARNRCSKWNAEAIPNPGHNIAASRAPVCPPPPDRPGTVVRPLGPAVSRSGHRDARPVVDRWRGHGRGRREVRLPCDAMSTPTATLRDPELDRIRWLDTVPYWSVHAIALAGLIWLGWSWTGFAICMGSYVVRMFGITAGYHRYFSHRTFKTSRVGQVGFALLGVISTQKGPLWWAAHHRHHHKYSDQPEDLHSPRQRGFWWSHMFWILVRPPPARRPHQGEGPRRYPSCAGIDRYEIWFTVAYAAALYLIGGTHALVWGYFVSHRAPVARHLHDQLAVPRLGQPSLPDGRRQPQQPAARDDHAGRGLAQQPPPLPALGAPGLLLVGGRSVVLRAQGLEAPAGAAHRLGRRGRAPSRPRPDRGPGPGSPRRPRGRRTPRPARGCATRSSATRCGPGSTSCARAASSRWPDDHATPSTLRIAADSRARSNGLPTNT
jgi:hypothetical protein